MSEKLEELKQRVYNVRNCVYDRLSVEAYEHVIKMINDIEQPKKYRRFKYLDELPFHMGEVILYRLKGETGSEAKALITEVSYTNDEKCAINCIGIGNKMLTTHECFADLELYNDECEWQPFGVLDE